MGGGGDVTLQTVATKENFYCRFSSTLYEINLRARFSVLFSEKIEVYFEEILAT